MKTKDEKKLITEYLKKLGSKGGKTRAAKYDKQTLSRWAKQGGRPRKERNEETE